MIKVTCEKKEKINKVFTGLGRVCIMTIIMKNCNLGLENAVLARPTASDTDFSYVDLQAGK